MKNVVITGSARGFGLTLAREFLKNNCNVIISDINEECLKEAKKELEQANYNGKVLAIKMDVTKQNDIDNLIKKVLKELNTIDIWINNAGVNQPDKPIWELEEKDIDRLLDIDLKGTILSSKMVVPVMIKQGSGQIYNIEGYGSNDATKLGLSIYGTSKRAVTYFTEALAKESETLKTNVLIGKITPGIMITNFITTSLGDGEKITYYEAQDEADEANYIVKSITSTSDNYNQFSILYRTNAQSRALEEALIAAGVPEEETLIVVCTRTTENERG